MDSWCPGLSDNESVRLSLHTAELSVLESFPSVWGLVRLSVRDLMTIFPGQSVPTLHLRLSVSPLGMLASPYFQGGGLVLKSAETVCLEPPSLLPSLSVPLELELSLRLVNAYTKPSAAPQIRCLES